MPTGDWLVDPLDRAALVGFHLPSPARSAARLGLQGEGDVVLLVLLQLVGGQPDCLAAARSGLDLHSDGLGPAGAAAGGGAGKAGKLGGLASPAPRPPPARLAGAGDCGVGVGSVVAAVGGVGAAGGVAGGGHQLAAAARLSGPPHRAAVHVVLPQHRGQSLQLGVLPAARHVARL